MTPVMSMSLVAFMGKLYPEAFLFQGPYDDTIFLNTTAYNFKIILIDFDIIFAPARKSIIFNFFDQYFKYFSSLRVDKFFSHGIS